MYKLKKFFPVLLISAMLLCAGPAYAQARYGLTVTAVAVETASAVGADSWVYGISYYAATGAGTLGIYDCATLEVAGNTNVKAEVGHATQYATATNWFEVPIFFTTAVTAVVTSGNVGFIYTGAEPN